MNSTIEQKMAVMKCFAGVQLGKRMMIGYRKGMLMYTNLYDIESLIEVGGKQGNM